MDVDAPGPSSRKRSSDQATEMPAAKRSRPVCKYGVKCYQKSALHREQFDHPSEGVSHVTGGICHMAGV